MVIRSLEAHRFQEEQLRELNAVALGDRPGLQAHCAPLSTDSVSTKCKWCLRAHTTPSTFLNRQSVNLLFCLGFWCDSPTRFLSVFSVVPHAMLAQRLSVEQVK